MNHPPLRVVHCLEKRCCYSYIYEHRCSNVVYNLRSPEIHPNYKGILFGNLDVSMKGYLQQGLYNNASQPLACIFYLLFHRVVPMCPGQFYVSVSTASASPLFIPISEAQRCNHGRGLFVAVSFSAVSSLVQTLMVILFIPEAVT